jgi:hypothetical protein
MPVEMSQRTVFFKPQSPRPSSSSFPTPISKEEAEKMTERFFGAELKAGEGEVTPEIGTGRLLRVCQIALPHGAKSRVTISATFDGHNITLGTLDPNSALYQLSTDLIFNDAQQVSFKAIGPTGTAVHLTGFYQTTMDDDDEDEDIGPFPDEEGEEAETDEEEEYDEDGMDEEDGGDSDDSGTLDDEEDMDEEMDEEEEGDEDEDDEEGDEGDEEGEDDSSDEGYEVEEVIPARAAESNNSGEAQAYPRGAPFGGRGFDPRYSSGREGFNPRGRGGRGGRGNDRGGRGGRGGDRGGRGGRGGDRGGDRGRGGRGGRGGGGRGFSQRGGRGGRR